MLKSITERSSAINLHIDFGLRKRKFYKTSKNRVKNVSDLFSASGSRNPLVLIPQSGRTAFLEDHINCSKTLKLTNLPFIVV